MSLGAVAAPPEGFTEAPALEPAASFVAGKAVEVDCARTYGDWESWLAAHQVRADAGGAAYLGSRLLISLMSGRLPVGCGSSLLTSGKQTDPRATT